MQNRRVLVVEDDPPTRLLVQALLEHYGYACEPCADGIDAIHRLRTGSYDAIVLDLMLPGQFGFEVLRYLRAERPSLLPRVVVMTAASPAMLRDFDGSQVCAVLHKPLDIDVLIEHIACAVLSGVPGSQPGMATG